MKKFMPLLVVAVAIGVGTLYFASHSGAQAPAYGTVTGTLLLHSSTLCAGTTSADGGHPMQYSTNSGSTWVDCSGTQVNGDFSMTPGIEWTGTMWVRAKPLCRDEGWPDHQHTPCDHGSFPYANNENSTSVGTLYTKNCPEIK